MVSSLDTSIGSLEIGCTVSIFLFGINSVQTLVYFSHFPEDSAYLKAFVGFVWFVLSLWLEVLELGHSILTIIGTYRLTVSSAINPRVSDNVNYLFTGILLGGITEVTVQIFFTLRLYMLLGKRPLRLCCSAMVVIKFIGIIVSSIENYLGPSPEEVHRLWKWVVIGTFIDGAVLDVVITISLFTYIASLRKRSNVVPVPLVDRILAWTTQTGFLTSVFSIIVAATFWSMQSNLVWMGAYMVLAKLYACALLGTLNARARFREGRQSPPPTTTTTRPSNSRHSHLKRTQGPPPSHINIEMHSKIEVKVEREKYDVRSTMCSSGSEEERS